MIELNSKIKEALIEIDFIKRYEEVSNKFNAERTPSKSRLVYIDGEEVMEIIQDLGYSPLFDSKEKFYKIRVLYALRDLFITIWVSLLKHIRLQSRKETPWANRK